MAIHRLRTAGLEAVGECSLDVSGVGGERPGKETGSGERYQEVLQSLRRQPSLEPFWAPTGDRNSKVSCTVKSRREAGDGSGASPLSILPGEPEFRVQHQNQPSATSAPADPKPVSGLHGHPHTRGLHT